MLEAQHSFIKFSIRCPLTAAAEVLNQIERKHPIVPILSTFLTMLFMEDRDICNRISYSFLTIQSVLHLSMLKLFTGNLTDSCLPWRQRSFYRAITHSVKHNANTWHEKFRTQSDPMSCLVRHAVIK